MTNFEVWIEGYSVQGNIGKAQFFGEFEGETFKDAVLKYYSTLSEEDRVLVDLETLTFWGCRFFDNEKDARKSFG